MDMPYNGLPNRPSPSPTPSRVSSPSMTSTQGNSHGTCCGGRFGFKKYKNQPEECAPESVQDEELNDIQIRLSYHTPDQLSRSSVNQRETEDGFRPLLAITQGGQMGCSSCLEEESQTTVSKVMSNSTTTITTAVINQPSPSPISELDADTEVPLSSPSPIISPTSSSSQSSSVVPRPASVLETRSGGNPPSASGVVRVSRL